MRNIIASLVLLAAALTGVAVQAQSSTPRWYFASAYNGWALKNQKANTYTFENSGAASSPCTIPNPYASSFYTFATNAPVLIRDLATPSNSEIVTPSSVSVTNPCGPALAPAHNHFSFLMQSGTAGLQEALNAAGQQSGSASHAGVIVLDSTWFTQAAGLPGTSAAAVIAAAKGSTSVALLDNSVAPAVWYTWSGSAYVASSTSAATFQTVGNGSSWTYFANSELITLSTSATTTDSAANLLPANSVIDMVQGVVNTTITAACTGWEIGDPTTAARFTANDTTLTAGEAKNGSVAITTGIANATTGIYQAAAAKIRITCAGGNPGAGKVRVVVYGRTFTPPTS